MLTTEKVKRISDELGIPIDSLRSGDGFIRACYDAMQYVGMLWCLCSKQAEAAGIGPEEFGEGFGLSLYDGIPAFEECIANFTPPALRPALAEVFAAQTAQVARVGQMATQLIQSEETQTRLDDQARHAMEAAAAQLGTGSPS